MPLALQQLYVGPLEGRTPPRIAGPADAAAPPGAALLDPAYLDALFARFGRQYGDGDRRAVASLWSKWHFSTLLLHGLAANLLLERDLPLGLGEVRVEVDEAGQTRDFLIPHAGRPLGTLDAFSRFTTLLDGHLTPLIEALAGVSGASPKVFWSNAGNYFEYFAGAVVQHPMAGPGVADEAEALMASRTLPDGRRNPLYRPVRYVTPTEPERPARVRRLCCIRYLINELGYCANCPLECRRTARATKAAG